MGNAGGSMRCQEEKTLCSFNLRQKKMKGLVVSGEMHHGTPGLRGVCLIGLTERERINRKGEATNHIYFYKIYINRDYKSLSPLFNSKMPLWCVCVALFYNHKSYNAHCYTTFRWWNIPWHCRVCNAWPVPPGCASMIYLKWYKQLDQWSSLNQWSHSTRFGRGPIIYVITISG